MEWVSLVGSTSSRRGLRAAAARAELARIEAANRQFVQGDSPTGPAPRVAVVITSEARTGSTYLQSLLAVGTDCQVLDYATACNPVPDDSGPDRATLIRNAKRRLRFIARTSPTLSEMRPLVATSPEECSVLFEYYGCSINLDLKFGNPAYSDWLWTLSSDGPEALDAYRWYSSLLGRIGATGMPWVLKAPGHLLALPALRTQFPEALFVRIRRPDSEQVPSALRLIRAIRSLYADAPPVGADIAAEWTPKLRDLTRRLDCHFAEEDEHLALEIPFSSLVAEPMSTVRAVAQLAGLSLRADVSPIAVRSARRNSMSLYRAGEGESAASVSSEPYSANRMIGSR